MNGPYDNVFATGEVRLVLTDEHGTVKHDEKVQNLVVTSGLGFIVSRMKDATASVMTHMAIGSGVTAEALGQTALVTELGRVALTNTTIAANVITYTATFPAGTGTGAVTEAGIFNASSSGTMLSRRVFGVINKASTDSLAVTWTVTVS
jgi:hypothetical protein